VPDPVTIVIPHFDAATLGDCLAALFEHSDHSQIHVIVVDDGPGHEPLRLARERFPQIEVLTNPENLGFSHSCNRGLAHSKTRYACLLNDDTRVTAGWLPPLIAMCDADQRIAACQPKLLSATRPEYFDYSGAAGGYVDKLGFTFCRGRILEQLEADGGQYDQPAQLSWGCGSALFVRVEAVQEVGLLDVDFFMHFEEIDLCWRLGLAGYRIMAVPASVVHHHAGWTLPPDSFRKKYLNHRNNLVALFKSLPLRRLAWVLPVRFFLEWIAALSYLAGRQGWAALAPPLALAWIALHPLNLWRRRRQARGLVGIQASVEEAGVYDGSILVDYYARRRRTSAELIRESGEIEDR
jgi:GT2 family glycosyltransferase